MATCCNAHCNAVPRTPSAVSNLAHLNECCKHKEEEIDPIQHPHAPFMARAIHLSRVAGLEKRTGELTIPCVKGSSCCLCSPTTAL